MNPTSRSAKAVGALIVGLTAGALVVSAPTSASAATRLCLSGTLAFDHRDVERAGSPLVTSPARNLAWTLTDRGVGTQPVASGSTNATNGTFSACYDALGGSRNLVLRFEARSGAVWRVGSAATASSVYSHSVAYATATSRAVGTVKVASTKAQAFKVADTVNELWKVRAARTSPCWTAGETAGRCSVMGFVWPASDTLFDLGGTNHVQLLQADSASKHIVLHEAGHAYQYLAHGRRFPAVDGCNPHGIDVASSPSCAWTEGFAVAAAAYALGDRRYVDETGWSTGLDNLDLPDTSQAISVEGNVAGALLELWAANGPDGNWDATINGMRTNLFADFTEYYDARPALGLQNVGVAGSIFDDYQLWW